MGRFISADDYISTGHELLSKNTFAYCHNNPIIYSDSAGTFPWLVVGIVALCITAIAVDHLLAANQPDGGYAVINETNENSITTKVLYAEGNGFEVDSNGITVCDTEVGLANISYESDYVAIEAVEVLSAAATAELDWSGEPNVDLSAKACIYNPSAEFVILLGLYEINVSVEGLIGAAAVGVEFDRNSGKFKITPPTLGIGGSYGIDIDFVG